MYQASTAAVSAVVKTTAIAGRRRCPSAGNGPKPKISTGDSGTSSTTPTQIASDGHEHVAGAADDAGQRIHQPDQPAPANTTFE